MIRVLSESIDLKGEFPDINNTLIFIKGSLYEYFRKDLQGSLLIEYDFRSRESGEQLVMDKKGVEE